MRVNKPESSLPVRLLRDAVLILLLLVFIMIAVNYFRHKEPETNVALMADASASRTFRGVFIRDEEVYTYSGDGVLSYNVADGGKLGNGTVIAEVYSDDRQLSINREKRKLENRLEILRKIQNPGTLQSAQPAALSENIEECYRELIYSRDKNDYTSVRSSMDDLLVKMSTYQIITNEVADFSGQIAELNDRLAELKNSSVDPKQVISSPRSAYFVSYADGYEYVLTPSSMDSLTIKDINSFTDRRSSDKAVVGKLIEGYGWYLVGIIDNTSKEYNIGDEVELRFDEGPDKYPAVIKNIRDEGNPAKSIVTIQCSAFNYDLVQHRVEDAEVIKGECSGLKVPRDAIRFAELTETVTDDNGEERTVTSSHKGVYVLKGEQVEFKKIDVVFEGSDYILSKVNETDKSYLALYDNIMIEGVE